MRTTIIAIGNSKGVRIPKVLLEESGINKDVDIKVSGGGLQITPIKSPKKLDETAVLSESALRRDWDKPEEDDAWASL